MIGALGRLGTEVVDPGYALAAARRLTDVVRLSGRERA